MPSSCRLAGLLFAFTLTAGAAHARPEPPGQAPDCEEVLERFPMSRSDLLLVPVQLKGKSYLFAIDTGAATTVYDASLAPLLGEPVSTQEVTTPSGKMVLPAFRPPDARLGNLSLPKGEEVFTADLR